MPLQAVKTEAKPTINKTELVAELAGLHGALVEALPWLQTTAGTEAHDL